MPKSGYRKTKITIDEYNDISSHSFKRGEKDALVNAILFHSSNDEERNKYWPSNIPPFEKAEDLRKNNACLAAERYNLNKGTVKSWVSRSLKRGFLLNHRITPGRYRENTFDEVASSELLNFYKNKRKVDSDGHVKPARTPEANAFIKKCAADTEKRRRLLFNNRRVSDTKELDPRTMQYFKESVGATACSAQGMTEIRAENLFNVRLIYVYACLTYMLERHLDPEFKWNADCTTFVCSSEKSEMTVEIVKDTSDPTPVRNIINVWN